MDRWADVSEIGVPAMNEPTTALVSCPTLLIRTASL